MQTKYKIDLLSSKLFVIGLLILLLNDHIFKYSHPCYLTGKLSDFAGLFIFPIFISVFWYNKRNLIYFFTGLFFIFWKSPLSEIFIESWNLIGIFKITRVVDYSDLIALLILPFSYKYIESQTYSIKNFRILKTSILGIISVFTFCATSQPGEELDCKMKLNKKYKVKISKENLIKRFETNPTFIEMEDVLKDSIYYCDIRISEKWTTLGYKIKIIEKNDSVLVSVDSLVNCYVKGPFGDGIDQKNIEFCNSLKENDYEKYFEEFFVNDIRNNKKSEKGRLTINFFY